MPSHVQRARAGCVLENLERSGYRIVGADEDRQISAGEKPIARSSLVWAERTCQPQLGAERFIPSFVGTAYHLFHLPSG
jgi:hypothetical protein